MIRNIISRCWSIAVYDRPDQLDKLKEEYPDWIDDIDRIYTKHLIILKDYPEFRKNKANYKLRKNE